jgi:hypothetical protein
VRVRVRVWVRARVRVSVKVGVEVRQRARITATSPLLAPLEQSSQKRSSPSDSAETPSPRCTHQPPPVKETALSPSKPTNEPSLCTASTLVPER